ncbi:MAG: hypothetical protein RLZZ297_449 [Chloroflexota bacterium]|jgi:catechol 2,3-dioxygenase-like lactoylglutathione lyase family enzyme
MVPHLHHVSVPRPYGAESAARARAFYTGILGLPELAIPSTITENDLVWFAIGDSELHVFAETAFDDPSTRHFCLRVADQGLVRVALTAAGYECSDTIPIPGRPRFFTRDPFGNSIEITSLDTHE